MPLFLYNKKQLSSNFQINSMNKREFKVKYVSEIN